METDRKKDSAKNAQELFLKSFQGPYDDESSWDAVRELRLRNTEEVFQLALAHSRSEVPMRRARALDVLGQLGTGKPLSERPHFDGTVSIALGHLRDEDRLVVHAAAWALAHLGGERSVAALLEVKSSADSGVRWAVANGMANSERPEAIRTLMELMEDDDENVRNWATFGLGNAYSKEDGTGRLGTLDSSEIRAALRKRLSDSSDEVRDEAVWGLARRRDQDGLQLLLGRLDSEQWVTGDEMAADDCLGLKCDASIEELRRGLRDLLEAN